MKTVPYSYKRLFWVYGLFFVTCSYLAAAVVDSDISRYKVIMDRKPFGYIISRVDPVVADEIVPVASQPSFAKDWTLSVVTTGPFGVRVGLRNRKSQRNHFVYVGDTCEDGVIVQDADYDKETVTLVKGNRAEVLSMHSSYTATPAGAPRSVSRIQPRRFTSSRPKREFKGLTREEYAKTKHLRPAPRSAGSSLRPKAPRFEGLTKEEEKAELRRYNMDLIRVEGTAGMPLPMALTPEEDAVLVAEGVLPPR